MSLRFNNTMLIKKHALSLLLIMTIVWWGMEYLNIYCVQIFHFNKIHFNDWKQSFVNQNLATMPKLFQYIVISIKFAVYNDNSSLLDGIFAYLLQYGASNWSDSFKSRRQDFFQVCVELFGFIEKYFNEVWYILQSFIKQIQKHLFANYVVH